MKAPLFAVTADNHLRPYLQGSCPDMVDDAYHGLHQVVDDCVVKHRCPLVILGDMTDKDRPDPGTVYQMTRMLDRVTRSTLDVYYILGNHDRSRSVGWPAVTLTAEHVHRRSFQIGPCRLYAFDNVSAAQLPEELALVPQGTDMLLCHQSWQEIQGGRGHADGRFEMVPGHVRCMVSGDNHAHVGYGGLNAAGEHMTVYSPGSTVMHRWDELPQKYYYLVYLTDRGTYEFQSVPIQGRYFYKWDLRDQSELDQAVVSLSGHALPFDITVLPESLRKPAARIRYPGNLPDAYERLTTAAADRVWLFLEPQPVHVEQVIDVDAEPAAYESLLSAVHTLARNRPAVRDGVLRLLNAVKTPDVLSREIETMFKAYQEQFLAEAQRQGDPAGVQAGPVV